MCIAMVKFAENNVKDCISNKKVSFIDVLNIYGTMRKTSYAMFISNRLIAYYNDRVEYFRKDYLDGDFLSTDEMIDDANFAFNISKL